MVYFPFSFFLIHKIQQYAAGNKQNCHGSDSNPGCRISRIADMTNYETNRTDQRRSQNSSKFAKHVVKSIKLGAVTFLPKEKMSDLKEFLEDVVLGGGKPIWKKLFDRMGDYFNRKFGPDWKEKGRFFKEFEAELIASMEKES